MSSAEPSSACQVRGAHKLPPEIGGAEAVCAAIKQALPGQGYSVQITVHSPSSISARVKTSDGRERPEQRMAVSDGALRSSSVHRFARAIADSLDQAR